MCLFYISRGLMHQPLTIMEPHPGASDLVSCSIGSSQGHGVTFLTPSVSCVFSSVSHFQPTLPSLR